MPCCHPFTKLFPRSTCVKKMKIVNTVTRGDLKMNLNLAAICNVLSHPDAVKITHQTKQPEQLLIKFATGNTMIIFKTGAFRMMGKDDSLESHFNIYEILCQFTGAVPDVRTQTMTVCHEYEHKIMLNKLACEEDVQYTAEHFPAVQVRKFKPVHINIFSSGKVTLTGVKNECDLVHIFAYLDNLVSTCFML